MIDRTPAAAVREVRHCLGCGVSSARPDLDFQVRRVPCQDTGHEEEAAFCHGEQCVASYLRQIREAPTPDRLELRAMTCEGGAMLRTDDRRDAVKYLREVLDVRHALLRMRHLEACERELFEIEVERLQTLIGLLGGTSRARAER